MEGPTLAPPCHLLLTDWLCRYAYSPTDLTIVPLRLWSMTFAGIALPYPLACQGPTSMCSVREHRFQNNAYIYIDSSNQIPTAIPSNRARIDTDLVQPTQCNVRPDRKTKKPCPKPWPLPKFEPLHIDRWDDHRSPNLPPSVANHNTVLQKGWVLETSDWATQLQRISLSNTTVFGLHQKLHIPE